MKPIRVALVGCGRIAKVHLQAILDLPEFECVAVCDPDPDRANEYGRLANAKVYSSLDDLLAHQQLDLVSLVTPSGLQPELSIQCADARVACLSEKPFGVFLKDSLRAVEHFKAKQVPLFVVFQNRFNPTVAKVHEWLKSGAFGRLYLLQSNIFWQRPQSYYAQDGWRGKRNLDGGVFMNQAVHYLDLMRWLGGPVDSVKSELATLGRDIECEDTGSAILRFSSGAIGSVSVTALAYPENLEGSLTIMGEKASVRIGGKALNRIEFLNGESLANEMSQSRAHDYEPKTVYGSGHLEYYRRLARALKNDGPTDLTTGAEALHALQLLDQIYLERDQQRGWK